jgi:CheY-like chemotaxis protein
MLQVTSANKKYQALNHTNYILIIEDNSRLRSVLARYVMLHCEAQNLSCALYHIGMEGRPRLNYYQHSDGSAKSRSEVLIPDFAVYEADSPRRALAWLKETSARKLTIISDVMMPSDTQVGLPGLVETLRQMQIAVNLIFVSSEAQNQHYVQSLVGLQPVLFLEKGSTAWRKLPAALVQESHRFTYQPIMRFNTPGANPSRTTHPVAEVKNPRLATAALGGNPVSALYPSPNLVNDYRLNTVAASSANSKSGRLWSRVCSWFSH